MMKKKAGPRPSSLSRLVASVIGQRQPATVSMDDEARAAIRTIAHWLDQIPGILSRADVVKLLRKEADHAE